LNGRSTEITPPGAIYWIILYYSLFWGKNLQKEFNKKRIDNPYPAFFIVFPQNKKQLFSLFFSSNIKTKGK